MQGRLQAIKPPLGFIHIAIWVMETNKRVEAVCFLFSLHCVALESQLHVSLRMFACSNGLLDDTITPTWKADFLR